MLNLLSSLSTEVVATVQPLNFSLLIFQPFNLSTLIFFNIFWCLFSRNFQFSWDAIFKLSIFHFHVVLFSVFRKSLILVEFHHSTFRIRETLVSVHPDFLKSVIAWSARHEWMLRLTKSKLTGPTIPTTADAFLKQSEQLSNGVSEAHSPFHHFRSKGESEINTSTFRTRLLTSSGQRATLEKANALQRDRRLSRCAASPGL